ncbi:MAG TPA: TetR/AcrR family transcriptional regulator [Solirubrobacteraceae bacterium]|nr:TetR/AcrR family transcriptional regulator [Solirubrobacteraceae bacterium]
MTSTQRVKARIRREEARERIVAAAEMLLLEHPYRDLTVDLVMSEAGLSRTVFYRHFDGLPEVLLTLLGKIEVELAAPMDSGDLRELLANSVEIFARYGPFLRALDHAAGQDAEIEAAYCALVDRFTEQIAAGLGGGPRAYELARALNLMNGHYLMDTLGKDPDFDRELALETLLTIWSRVLDAN